MKKFLKGIGAGIKEAIVGQAPIAQSTFPQSELQQEDIKDMPGWTKAMNTLDGSEQFTNHSPSNQEKAYKMFTEMAKKQIIDPKNSETLWQNLPPEFANHLQNTRGNKIENLTEKETLTLFLLKQSALSPEQISKAFESYKAGSSLNNPILDMAITLGKSKQNSEVKPATNTQLSEQNKSNLAEQLTGAAEAADKQRENTALQQNQTQMPNPNANKKENKDLQNIESIRDKIFRLNNEMTQKSEEIAETIGKIDQNSEKYRIYTDEFAQISKKLQELTQKTDEGWQKTISDNTIGLAIAGVLGAIILSPFALVGVGAAYYASQKFTEMLQNQSQELENQLNNLQAQIKASKTETLANQETLEKLEVTKKQLEKESKANQKTLDKVISNIDKGNSNLDPTSKEKINEIKAEAIKYQQHNHSQLADIAIVIEGCKQVIAETKENDKKLTTEIKDAQTTTMRLSGKNDNSVRFATYLGIGSSGFTIAHLLSANLFIASVTGLISIAAAAIVHAVSSANTVDKVALTANTLAANLQAISK